MRWRAGLAETLAARHAPGSGRRLDEIAEDKDVSHLKRWLGAEGVEDPGVQGAVEEGGNVLVGVWTGAGLGDGTLCSGRTALEAVEGFSRELEAMGCEGHLLG